MANRFKILVDLNYDKYSVIIDSDYKIITFKSVYNEILRQTKQNISIETHLFELFDIDFKEYVLITTDKQIIENLSRIRVKPKDSNQLSDGLDTNCTEKELKLMTQSDKELPKEESSASADNMISCDLNSIQNTFNNLFSEKKCQKTDNYLNNLINKSKEKNVNKEKVVETEELTTHLNDDTLADSIGSESVSTNGQTSGKTHSNATNYLDLELSHKYTQSSSSPIISYKTFVVEIHNKSVIGMRYYFKHFKAIRQMLDLLDINRNCFEINGKNNWISNPKWKTISDQMIINGFDDWCPQKCRDGFINALDLYKKTLDKCPDFDTADLINPLFFPIHSFDMKFIISLSEFNVIRDLRQLFDKKNSKKFAFNRKNVGSNLALVSMNADFENQKRLENKSVIDRSKMRKMQKMTQFDINWFKALAKCVETVVKEFGHVSYIKHFWELVSNQMKANGYQDCDAMAANNVFTEYVCDYYTLLLIRSPDYKSATEVYPLFQFIHSMDLSRCLSYHSFQKVQDLRQRFGKN